MKKSPAYCDGPQIAAGCVAKAPRFVMIGRHVALATLPDFGPSFDTLAPCQSRLASLVTTGSRYGPGDFFTASDFCIYLRNHLISPTTLGRQANVQHEITGNTRGHRPH